MKYKLSILIIMLLVSCKSERNFSSNSGIIQSSEKQQPAVVDDLDLPKANSVNPILEPTTDEVSSIWYSDDYECLNARNQEEIIKISRNGNKLTATKTIGTECIKANEVTWEATIDPITNKGVGVLYSRLPFLNIENTKDITVELTDTKITVTADVITLVFDLQRQ